MAKAEVVEFSVSLRDLPEKILVPRVALTRPDLVFERLPDDRKNWILVPDASAIAKGGGRVGATLRLKGTGNSIADAAAKADGRIAATVVNGRISNLLDAASGLNGGKVLTLLAGGDKDIVIRCGGVNFDVTGGRGKSTLFVIDTEQTQVLGTGGFDLEKERFDLTVAPNPKEFGLLSLRTPMRLHGSFKEPEFEVVKGPLVARVGAALGLAAVNPLAALLPFIETGPGEESNCGAIQRQAGNPPRGTKEARSHEPETPL